MSKEESEKRVAIYARVSTGNQGTGLEAQIRALRNYCSQKGIQNILLFQDENQSGVKSSRPALDKMMKSVRNKEIDRVVVYSFSRYARSTSHLLSALEEFKKLGVEFVSISENIETNSPLGVAIFSILGAVAQLERDILIERVKNGLANAKAKGVQLGRKKTRDSELIRRLYLTGVTYREIGRIAKCSSGAVSAEVRELKKELAETQELEKALKERDYESVKQELERSRHRVATLESKVPDEHKGVTTTQNVHKGDNEADSQGSPVQIII
jgi:DNA invertase Pin-like site-specific DNA recombinase